MRLIAVSFMIFASAICSALAQQPQKASGSSSVDFATFPNPVLSPVSSTSPPRVAEPIEYNGPCNYLGCLNRKVRNLWLPPKTAQKLITKVVFTIARDGKLSNAHVTKPSGNAAADAAAVKAVEMASPFFPLPEGCRPETVDFEITFSRRASVPSVEGKIMH